MLPFSSPVFCFSFYLHSVSMFPSITCVNVVANFNSLFKRSIKNKRKSLNILITLPATKMHFPSTVPSHIRPYEISRFRPNLLEVHHPRSCRRWRVLTVEWKLNDSVESVKKENVNIYKCNKKRKKMKENTIWKKRQIPFIYLFIYSNPEGSHGNLKKNAIHMTHTIRATHTRLKEILGMHSRFCLPVLTNRKNTCKWRSCYGVGVYVLHCHTIESKFEFQSRYYIHTNNLGKDTKPTLWFNLLAMG